MPESAATVTVIINGQVLQVPAGCTVTAALAYAGLSGSRRSVTGLPRGPLCGMGICFECRVQIDDQPQQRSCQTACREGMRIRTDE